MVAEASELPHLRTSSSTRHREVARLADELMEDESEWFPAEGNHAALTCSIRD